MYNNKRVIFSVAVSLIHTIYGVNDMSNPVEVVKALEKTPVERVEATKDETVLSDPAGTHEDLNEMIAAACAHTRGNGDI